MHYRLCSYPLISAVCHHVIHQGGVLDGSLGDKAPGHIKAEQMTDAVWDYIFKRGAFPKGCTIAEPTLQKMRREFEYWYALDGALLTVAHAWLNAEDWACAHDCWYHAGTPWICECLVRI